eukprot:COSAG06_NODE_1608_length_8946_cov_17.020685_3_plen_39_part_00
MRSVGDGLTYNPILFSNKRSSGEAATAEVTATRIRAVG